MRALSEDRDPEPSAGVNDSPRQKCGNRRQQELDAGKMINGIIRHIIVDTCGLVWKAVVHTTDLQDCDGSSKPPAYLERG